MSRFLRSLLFMPASNPRALEKAAGLAADALIFDLEDAVAPEAKHEARAQLSHALATHTYSGRVKILRINALETLWGAEDAALAAGLAVDAILLPKAETTSQIDTLATLLPPSMPIWANIETPLAVVNAASIAAHERVQALVAGTNDLSKDLRITRTDDRSALLHSLSAIVLAARAYGKQVYDGTFIRIKDEAAFMREAQQGKLLGFDGKTLIHPDQIATCNAAFSPTDAEINHAVAVVSAYEQAMRAGKAVTTVDGQMIEALHYAAAKQVLIDNKKQ